MSGPRVSIVIPYYKLQDYLEECLRSVRAQDFQNWEAIVVDDCSPTGDPAALIAALGDARIRLRRHATNRGLGAARNTGFEAASAALLLPLDGDDLLAPAFLAKLLALLEQDPELDCAFSDFELFGAQSGRRAHRLEPVGAMTRYQWLPGAGVLLKRDLWRRAGRYNEDPVLRLGNEDWDFWLRAAASGFRAAHVAEPLYRYRQHVSSMSHGLRARDHVTRRYLLRHHRAFFQRHGGARPFLATGYWNSSNAAREQGRTLASLAYACRAVSLDGDWPRARNHLSVLLPEGLLTHLRRRAA